MEPKRLRTTALDGGTKATKNFASSHGYLHCTLFILENYATATVCLFLWGEKVVNFKQALFPLINLPYFSWPLLK